MQGSPKQETAVNNRMLECHQLCLECAAHCIKASAN